MSKDPVFIVGAPRSGTTLLQYMLRSHPDLSLPTGESHFIVPLMRNEANYGDLSQPDNIRRVLEAMHRQRAEFLETDLYGQKFDVEVLTSLLKQRGCRTMRDLITGLFELNAEGEGKSRWGDKTPYYVLHMQRLQNWWPAAQFIHLVRDGRDVALSMLARQRDLFVYNVYSAAKYWEQYVETGREQGAALRPGTYLEIRYEDLVTDQRSTVVQICQFLGIEYLDSMLEYEKGSGQGQTPLLRQPVQATNQDKWRNKMSAREIAVVESGVAPTLQRFGYPLTTPATRLALPTRALYRWHNSLLERYWRMKSGRGR